MFCSKCGKEIMDEAVICPHCGCAQQQNQQIMFDKQNTAKLNISKLKSGKILNIIATVLFVIAIVYFFISISSGGTSMSSTSNYTNGGTTTRTTTTISTSISSNDYLLMIGEALTIMIGYIIIILKNTTAKKTLGTIYFSASIILIMFFALRSLFSLIYDIGLAFILITIACILQIVAGAKFFSIKSQ